MGMSDSVRLPRTSMIGVRAAWTCCICRAHATTYQLVNAGDLSLDLPKGWSQRDGHTYCPDVAVQSAYLTLKDTTIRDFS